ncbi:ribonuclease E/G [uncultured Aliiroseovarius sp.]|uniref:ribonuclease E/G n=1 Tax=uncultured Aliiroseovarius sp. TaxID=1658783 RepID=UPI00259896FC|nr:ribonuclease E/G [uncultured Aliiroseovarius sp.]
MPKKMLIDATHAEETRVVVVDGNKVEEFDFESENKRQLAGNIYLAKVTRVEPSLQAAFVDYGGNRHGFLAFSEIHPDYYQIPVADREALLEEERAYAEAMATEEEKPKSRRRRSRPRSQSKAEEAMSDDAVTTKEIESSSSSMDVIDLEDGDENGNGDPLEGQSPMELVEETPVEEPIDEPNGDDQPSKAKDDSSDDDSSDDDDSDDDDDAPLDATEKDDQIESVADDDSTDDIRPRRKPRPKRYKIQEVIKVRQILLVQVVKEERGNKGAALTTYLSLAGRYCVLMPNTARGGGISRKITNAPDRKKLKEIAAEIDVPTGAGLIVRTAGAKRTKSEIRRDYEYLQRLWEQIRELTLNSTAPAKIYEEGNLIKRSIRDLYSREIDEVFVEGEVGYRTAKDFMKMIMPSHAKNVKLYQDQMPLFARYQVESYLSGMFSPTVQLKSGGYIVIGVTEALVAIDVNSGRATKEGSIEETALKTNLEAAEEVARQLRLRDLAGLIVIDFIDMDERRNNNAVEKRMKDKLKTDRARIQVGRISGFGLMEMSRQRLRPGMIEATTQPCHHCHGTGLIRSDDNLALSILRQLEEEGVRRRSREALVKAPVGIVNFLVNNKREHIAQIEARYGMAVRVEGDPSLVSPDFTIEKFKTATRTVPESSDAVVSVDASLMQEIDDVEEAEVVPHDNGEDDETKPKKRRRPRRRRRKPSNGGDESSDSQNGDSPEQKDASPEVKETAPTDDKTDTPAADADEKPKRKRAPRKRGAGAEAGADDATNADNAAAADGADADATAKADADAKAEADEKPKRKRAPRKRAAAVANSDEAVVQGAASEADVDEAPKKPARKPRAKKAIVEDAKTDETEAAPTDDAKTEVDAKPAKPTRKRAPAKRKKVDETANAPEGGADVTPMPAPETAEPAPDTTPAPAPESAKPDVTPEPQPASDEPSKPKRKGWWSLGR